MPQAIPGATAYAKVTSLRAGRFVEFVFMINDDDLSLELIMPLTAFREFCDMQSAVVLDAEGVLTERNDAAAGGRGMTGLYRRPEQHAQPH